MKRLITLGVAVVAAAMMFGGIAATVTATSMTAQQRYPWNGLVDITVTINGSAEDVKDTECTFAATNSATKSKIPIAHIIRNGADTGLDNVWTRKFIWDAKADIGAMKIDDVVLSVEAFVGVQLWEGGPYWATCNVGAKKPEECGYYFSWGDTVGYGANTNSAKQCGDNYWNGVKWVSSTGVLMRNTPFWGSTCQTYNKSNLQLHSENFIDVLGNLAAAYDAATAHLGVAWRMPTDAELSKLISNCDTEWTMRNGVAGRLVKGRGAYASRNIFLPAVGFGYGDILRSLGSNGIYWSSTPDSDNPNGAWYLCFNSDGFYRRHGSRRYHGSPVRPVRGFTNGTGGSSGATTHLSFDF